MNEHKILVLGSSGQIASCLKEVALSSFLFIGRPALDITSLDLVNKVVDFYKPGLIINCAAYTEVDKAEQEVKAAYAVNSEAVKDIAILCHAKDIPLIHLSTDYVFDGKKEEPYKESDITNPLSVYGQSKCNGEENVRKYLDKHIIIRTSWVVSSYGNNFVKTMIRLATQQLKVVKVVNDQRGCPTIANNIAEAITIIARQIFDSTLGINYGTYHYSDYPSVTWYEFAVSIFAILKEKHNFKVPDIIPVSTSEYPAIALRPQNSVLDCALIKENFGINNKSWQDDLAGLISKILIE